MHGEVGLAQPACALSPGEQATSEARWQYGGDLLDARLEVLRDRKRFLVLGAYFGPNPRHPLRRCLGLRHPDHILEGHAHGQVPRRLTQEIGRAQGMDGVQPIEIERRVAAILIAGEAADALFHDVEARGRIGPTRPLDQIFDALRRGLPLAVLPHRLLQFTACMAASEGKGREIGVDRLAGMPDGGLESAVGDRQLARSGQCAQQDGVDHAPDSSAA